MRITHLFDPLCGWCYGAGPALEELSQLIEEDEAGRRFVHASALFGGFDRLTETLRAA